MCETEMNIEQKKKIEGSFFSKNDKFQHSNLMQLIFEGRFNFWREKKNSSRRKYISKRYIIKYADKPWLKSKYIRVNFLTVLCESLLAFWKWKTSFGYTYQSFFLPGSILITWKLSSTFFLMQTSLFFSFMKLVTSWHVIWMRQLHSRCKKN